MTAALLEVPSRAADVLEMDDQIIQLAKRIVQARDVLYLGRGNCFPIALEGALKLKEISYIHAEGYPAGEMKHGPNALIDEKLPVVVLALSLPAHVAVKVAVNDCQVGTGLPVCVLGKVREASSRGSVA